MAYSKIVLYKRVKYEDAVVLSFDSTNGYWNCLLTDNSVNKMRQCSKLIMNDN